MCKERNAGVKHKIEIWQGMAGQAGSGMWEWGRARPMQSTNNKEKRKASSTGKLHDFSKNILTHKERDWQTRERKSPATMSVPAQAAIFVVVVAVVIAVVSAAKMPAEKLTAL